MDSSLTKKHHDDSNGSASPGVTTTTTTTTSHNNIVNDDGRLTTHAADDVKITVDDDILNGSRSPLDPKLYRHITLPNGLQALLIQDTIAMQHLRQQGGGDLQPYNDDDDDENDEEDKNDPEPSTVVRVKHGKNDDDDESEDDDDDDDDNDNDGLLREAACCIVVGGGSVSDPPHCPGLAHFLEHLLFMGSDKYPGENEYPSYIAKHGGIDAAHTEWEYTSYSFTVSDTYALFGALDRLVQFFIAPLLRTNAIERELQSIESEFRLNQMKDHTRHMQLLCSTCRPNHPITKFSWGNTASIQSIPSRLGYDAMTELRTFYNQHYYAQNMRLVIQGPYTLDVLQDNVLQYCADIPAVPRDTNCPPQRQLQTMQQAGFPFRTEILGTITRIVPVKECHTLIITWQIPCQYDNWRCKPVDFISHLLGHEASGSLLSYVRSQSWATACMAGGGDDEGCGNATSHALFTISFSLSTAGLQHWRDIVDAVYQYIGMMKYYCANDGWPTYIYKELQSINELSYKYGDEASPDETVEYYAEEMAPHYHHLPTERILDGSYLLFEFDSNAIHTLLEDYMKPELARIDLLSSSFGKPSDYYNDDDETTTTPPPAAVPVVNATTTTTTNTETIVSTLIIHEENLDGTFDVTTTPTPQVDPMFGTQFWCHKLPSTLIEGWILSSQPCSTPAIETLCLPPPNPFVPTNLQLKEFPKNDADHPLLNASLKVCVLVGRTKQWFPGTVIQYHMEKNSVLLSYEDEDEKWHVLDNSVNDFTPDILLRCETFEGTMDRKTIKYRIVALSLHPGAKGAGIRKFGDECDLDVEDGISFPPIPPPSTRVPIQIANSNTLKLWWLQDRKFKRPIGEFRLQVVCINANQSPLHRAVADLQQYLCEDALIETSYLAEMCDLDSSIGATDIGFNLRFNGYNDKLLDLFQTTMKLLLSFRGLSDTLPTSVDRFDACLETLRRNYKNAGMTSAKLASSVRLQCIRPNVFSAHKKLAALDGITIPLFCQTVSSIWESYSVEAFIHGNFDRKDADHAKDVLLELLESGGGAILPRKKYPSQSVLRIPSVDVTNVLILPSKDPEEPNTACEVYIQIGKDNLHDRVMMDLLMHIINEPLFDQIRTKDQFGYDVYCDVRWSYGIIGCIFHVTTNVKSASEVAERIDTFLIQFREELLSMSSDDFAEQVAGLAKQKLAMFDSLSDETGCLWGEIHDGRFEWEAWRDETLCLRSMSKESVIKAYDAWLLPGHRRNILTIQVVGAVQSDESSSSRPLVDAESFSDFVDEQISSFHQICKKQTWGRVNSKLF